MSRGQTICLADRVVVVIGRWRRGLFAAALLDQLQQVIPVTARVVVQLEAGLADRGREVVVEVLLVRRGQLAAVVLLVVATPPRDHEAVTVASASAVPSNKMVELVKTFEKSPGEVTVGGSGGVVSKVVFAG